MRKRSRRRVTVPVASGAGLLAVLKDSQVEREELVAELLQFEELVGAAAGSNNVVTLRIPS
jgi:hypothetical protein